MHIPRKANPSNVIASLFEFIRIIVYSGERFLFLI